jgi:hypothetical protein
MQAVSTGARQGRPSRLEAMAVTPGTLLDYQRRVQGFLSFCRRAGLATSDDESLQVALLEYLDWAFLAELRLDHGTKLLASLTVEWPHLHRAGRLGRLPRVSRALQAWSRLDPLLGRLPMPWVGAAGIMVALMVMGFPRLAVAVAVAMDAYLRPGEMLSLTSRSFVLGRPRLGRGHQFMSLLLFPSDAEASSKTHQYDESVVLDSPDRQWITTAVLRLLPQLRPGETFVGVSYSTFLKIFGEASLKAGLGVWQVTPHVLRHTGPSIDYLRKARTLDEIQRRGRWASSNSVRRYERASQVNARLLALTDSTVRFLEQASLEAPNMLSLGIAPSAQLKVLLARVQCPA